MKLMVAGSRSISDFDLAPYIPEEVTLIISGGARGIDRLAEEYADAHGLSKLILRPQYNRYGKAAPLRRNVQALEAADRVLVIWDGASRGTAYTIKQAEARGKPIAVIPYSKNR